MKSNFTNRVDSSQVLHRPKPSVSLHPVRLVHPTLRLAQETRDLIGGALRTVVKVLARPLSYPDGLVERLVEEGHVLLKIGRINVVIICVTPQVRRNSLRETIKEGRTYEER